MKKLLLLSLISLFSTAAYGETTNTGSDVADKNTVVVPCKVDFVLGKADFNQKELKTCIDSIPSKEALKYIQIVTSATPAGSKQFNEKLTDKRAYTLQDYLKTQFPTSQIRFVSIGRNERYGKTGLINFVLAKNLIQTNTIVKEASASASTNSTKESNVIQNEVTKKTPFDVRAAFRLGRDIYMVDRQAAFFSVGGEASAQFKKSDSIKYEVGLQGSQLVNDNYLTIYAYYLLGGAYYVTPQGISLGGRVLLGGVTNQNHEVDHDEGGELRLGYDYKMFSIGAGVGRTTNTARFGLDLGVNL